MADAETQGVSKVTEYIIGVSVFIAVTVGGYLIYKYVIFDWLKNLPFWS